MKTIDFPKELIELARAFPLPLYAVGGQIRNPLLGLPVGDRDICSALPPEAVMDFCRARGIGFVPQGLAYGTVAIHLEEGVYEHTTFRSDSYAPGGAHRPQAVAFSTSLAADAARRDFSVNALYMQLGVEAAPVLDPTGKGLADIKARLLRATSEDPALILQNDALRILRLARFAAELGFSVEEATFEAARAHAAGLGAISAERKWAELVKLLLADTKYPGAWARPAACGRRPAPAPHPAAPGAGAASLRDTAGAPGASASSPPPLSPAGACLPGHAAPVYYGLSLLDALGALPFLFPALESCRDFAQRTQYHAYDVLGHCLHTAACMAAAEAPAMEREELLILRLSALLHDIGKPEALKQNAADPAAAGHMYGHDKLGARMAAAALADIKAPRHIAQEACTLIERHMFDLTGQAKEATLRERFARWGYEESLRLVHMRRADVYGSGRTPPEEAVPTAERFVRVLEAMRAANAPFSEAELCCTGADIMAWTGLPPGPAVGKIKRDLLRHCARRPADNRPERLKRLAQSLHPQA